MKPRAYIETTVVSYLTAWPSRDVVIAGHQQVTRDWWLTAADRFELVASQLVVNEASAGDPEAASGRIAALRSITLLDATDKTLALATPLGKSAIERAGILAMIFNPTLTSREGG